MLGPSHTSWKKVGNSFKVEAMKKKENEANTAPAAEGGAEAKQGVEEARAHADVEVEARQKAEAQKKREAKAAAAEAKAMKKREEGAKAKS